ncbi:protein of unknown function [Denitratisoma oestradiolicum]|uniref:Uncharacterized protein n=1 Tax=Denitratisoma oestradiolicum TaxID=311182 RepID=A0A6S6XUK7_9PROT|nr:protein of unknown function [Denitratisoma oestradiolicum]
MTLHAAAHCWLSTRSWACHGCSEYLFLGRYNRGFYGKLAMDAERLNQIANRIADLTQRGNELRRYL